MARVSSLVRASATAAAAVVAGAAVLVATRTAPSFLAERVGRIVTADAAPPSTALGDTDAEVQASAAPNDADVPRRPRDRTHNVILITIDTLRWDLGFTGYPRPVTPNLDSLAERSTVYERAYATASYTPKSVGPMLIGRYASETFRDSEHYTTFYPANVFVAERVRDAGHRTVAAMCHHYFKWNTGLDQGFDVWDTSATPPKMVDNDPSVTSDKLTDVALSLLSKTENTATEPGRFFAWFHYTDPHLPYVPHDDAPDLAAAAPDAAPPERALYDQEVWFTDKHVGRLLDHVASQPWAAETAIIVTSDHGEAFGERGFRRHGRELFEPVVRVPLIVHVPDAAPRRVADVKRSHVDLVPTILELMGVAVPDESDLRGKSLLVDVDADPDAPLDDRDVLMDMPRGPFNEMRRAVVTDGTPGTKLIDYGERRYELFDLAADPLETKPINADVTRLKRAIARLEEMTSALREVTAAP